MKPFQELLLSRMAVLVRETQKNWWLSALLWLAIAIPAKASVDLRVAIEEGVSQVTVGSSTRALVRDSSGKEVGEIAAMNAFVAQPEAGKVKLDRWQGQNFWIEPTNGGYVFIGDRWYRGRTQVVPTAKGLTAVNYVNLEHYLYSVLGGEMVPSWPLEALKAQAVAARSYALYQRENAANSVFDLGDTAAWQVYRGISDETASTQSAVNATASQVLINQGRIIEAVFHSASGGHTENVEHIWVQRLPYLRGVPDFDQGTPVYEWTKTFSRADLSALIAGVGNVIAMEPEQTTPQGRVISMRVVGDAGSRSIKGETLRSILDLRSTKFKVVPEFASTPAKQKAQSAPIAFQIQGKGFGHGLGLSQWGAYNLARQGRDYRQIVLHYYKNTILAKIQVK
ncbi:MAG: SpoIID/LytB domain-containing protein [Leptolyngbyaceae cyanobacterium bins.302]|nr:SpoIID/LytB domain-containing protein [Leptolyngbyaceae cyanobacterium bins.302]